MSVDAALYMISMTTICTRALILTKEGRKVEYYVYRQ